MTIESQIYALKFQIMQVRSDLGFAVCSNARGANKSFISEAPQRIEELSLEIRALKGIEAETAAVMGYGIVGGPAVN